MPRIAKDAKIIVPGGAGLVGQNLLILLKERGYTNLTVIDKHKKNAEILKELHPDVSLIVEDLAKPGPWQDALKNAAVIIQLQAQIGGLHEQEFIANNIESTRLILASLDKNNPPYLIHVSSSVVNSKAYDFYTETKKAQEQLVVASGLDYVALRPTLMFGWFDRKHLGWLARFMQKMPVFPVPGIGRYLRQPLYAKDFCNIILSCLENGASEKIYDISGMEKMNYIDIIRSMKTSAGAKARIVKIPYSLFRILLQIYVLFSSNPPFTVKQLEALVIPEEFDVIDWPGIFKVTSTPLGAALDQTFQHPVYSDVVLEF